MVRVSGNKHVILKHENGRKLLLVNSVGENYHHRLSIAS